MRTVHRFVVTARSDVLKDILSEAKDISRTTLRKELRLVQDKTWIDFRIPKDLWEAGLPDFVVLVIAVRQPLEYEIKPFRKIWHIDVYAPTEPEQVLAVFKEDFQPCEEWSRRATRLLTPPNQKGSEIIHRLKKLLAELEEGENGE